MNWSSPEGPDGLTALMELVVPFLVMKRSQQSFSPEGTSGMAKDQHSRKKKKKKISRVAYMVVARYGNG
jgi:hypothetical protein